MLSSIQPTIHIFYIFFKILFKNALKATIDDGTRGWGWLACVSPNSLSTTGAHLYSQCQFKLVTISQCTMIRLRQRAYTERTVGTLSKELAPSTIRASITPDVNKWIDSTQNFGKFHQNISRLWKTAATMLISLCGWLNERTEAEALDGSVMMNNNNHHHRSALATGQASLTDAFSPELHISIERVNNQRNRMDRHG